MAFCKTLVAAALCAFVGAVAAQSFPTKPITIVVPNPPGGVVNFASQGNGSLSHVGTVLLEQETSTKMTHVPYKGSGAAIADVVGGQVQLCMTTPPSVLGHIQTGKLRAYAVTSKTRHPMLPNVPTTTEAGLPGFEPEAWVGLFAPAGTPQAVANQLTEASKKALDTPEANARGAAQGIEVRFLGQEALAALVKRETDYWTKVIKSRNITAD